MKKRILSMLLVLVLLVALVPLHADAAVTIYWPVPGAYTFEPRIPCEQCD